MPDQQSIEQIAKRALACKRDSAIYRLANEVLGLREALRKIADRVCECPTHDFVVDDRHCPQCWPADYARTVLSWRRLMAESIKKLAERYRDVGAAEETVLALARNAERLAGRVLGQEAKLKHSDLITSKHKAELEKKDRRLKEAIEEVAVQARHDVRSKKRAIDAELKVTQLRALLKEWRSAPFFDAEADWEDWVAEFGARVDATLRAIMVKADARCV